MPAGRTLTRLLPTFLVAAIALALTAACDDNGGSSDTPSGVGTSVVSGTPFAEDSEHVSIVNVDEEIILDGHLFGRSNDVGVVLSHMRPNDQVAWYPFAQQLANEGYAALTYDFRGHGASEGAIDFSKLDEDLREALRFMMVDRQLDTVFLIGASMGGTTSIVVASEDADVAGVVAISPPAEFEEQNALEAIGDIDEPLLLIASEDDAPSLRFEELLDAAGDGAESKVYSGAAHGTALFDPETGHAQQIQDLILAFLRESGGP